MQSSDAQQTIKDKLHDQNVRISCIGPAGEKLSRLACIVNERRVVGRRGLGAVMGAKNLKAIALRGEQPVAIADPEKFKDGAQAHARRHEGQPGALLAVRARGHLRQRGELHGAGHLPLEQLDDHRGREVRGDHRRRRDRHARRRAHRLR